ncbi:UNVERIFIED_ORG: hypothetical protein ABIB13_003225 [Arthrobacter sp. UYEF2]
MAFNGATPTNVLNDVATRRIDLALLVALNPDCPDEVLGAPANDAEPLIRFIATGMRTNRAAPIPPRYLTRIAPATGSKALDPT